MLARLGHNGGARKGLVLARSARSWYRSYPGQSSWTGSTSWRWAPIDAYYQCEVALAEDLPSWQFVATSHKVGCQVWFRLDYYGHFWQPICLRRSPGFLLFADQSRGYSRRKRKNCVFSAAKIDERKVQSTTLLQFLLSKHCFLQIFYLPPIFLVYLYHNRECLHLPRLSLRAGQPNHPTHNFAG